MYRPGMSFFSFPSAIFLFFVSLFLNDLCLSCVRVVTIAVVKTMELNLHTTSMEIRGSVMSFTFPHLTEYDEKKKYYVQYTRAW